MFNNQSIFDKLCTCLWQPEPTWFHGLLEYIWPEHCSCDIMCRCLLILKGRVSLDVEAVYQTSLKCRFYHDFDGIQHKTEESTTSHQSEFKASLKELSYETTWNGAFFKCLLTKFTRSRCIAQLPQKRVAWGPGYHQTETTRIRNSHPRTTLAVAEHRALLSEYFVKWVWPEEFCP